MAAAMSFSDKCGRTCIVIMESLVVLLQEAGLRSVSLQLFGEIQHPTLNESDALKVLVRLTTDILRSRNCEVPDVSGLDFFKVADQLHAILVKTAKDVKDVKDVKDADCSDD